MWPRPTGARRPRHADRRDLELGDQLAELFPGFVTIGSELWLTARCHSPMAAVPRSRMVASAFLARGEQARHGPSRSPGGDHSAGTEMASSRSRLLPA